MTTNISQVAADELLDYMQALRDGVARARAESLDISAMELAETLTRLAADIHPASSFASNLEMTVRERAAVPHSKLNMTDEPGSRRILVALRNVLGARRIVRVGIGVGGVLLVTMVLAMPALAQFALAHFSPREVATLPISAAVVTVVPVPSSAHMTQLGDLEAQAGFSILVPRYLPGSCEFKDGSFLPQPIGEVDLEYNTPDEHACFDIAEQKTRTDKFDQPFIGTDSAQSITINGQPAIYIHGMWWVDMQRITGSNSSDKSVHVSPQQLQDVFKQAVWVEGPKQIVFEDNGLLIRINGDTSLTKDVMIQIAQSIK
jgi:hypothetical protein